MTINSIINEREDDLHDPTFQSIVPYFLYKFTSQFTLQMSVTVIERQAIKLSLITNDTSDLSLAKWLLE